jgi:hypothetical protein
MVLPFLPNERNASDNPWIVFDYEIQMYFETRNLIKHLASKRPSDVVNRINQNAVIESMILHSRIITDILISNGNQDDDILLKDLLPEWCGSEVGKNLIANLANVYGKSNKEGDPRWVINKMMAHPTKWRTDRFNYSLSLRQIEPAIIEVLLGIEIVTHRPILSYYLQVVKINTEKDSD